MPFLNKNKKEENKKETKIELIFQGAQVECWTFALPFMHRFNRYAHCLIHVCVFISMDFEKRIIITYAIFGWNFFKTLKFVTKIFVHSHTSVSNDNEKQYPNMKRKHSELYFTFFSVEFNKEFRFATNLGSQNNGKQEETVSLLLKV